MPNLLSSGYNHDLEIRIEFLVGNQFLQQAASQKPDINWPEARRRIEAEPGFLSEDFEEGLRDSETQSASGFHFECLLS
jgi:hypothetical protein